MANFIDWDDVDTTQKTRSSGGGAAVSSCVWKPTPYTAYGPSISL